MIYTYGGGEILHKIFNGIAMLMNNNGGGIARPLMIIFISIASLWALTKAFFSSSAEVLLSKYFFPVLAIAGIFLVPTKTVRIQDAVTSRYYTVDHVPFLLAQFSQFASSLGHHVTEAVEKVMHVPNDLRYNSTGMVFGAESAMDVSKYKIRNGDFARNLKGFSKQCVFYDVLLGRYTLEEMQQTTDLWKFLEERSSTFRFIEYVDPEATNPAQSVRYLNCQQAVKTMAPFLEKEKNYYALQDIGKHLPTTFLALTNLQESAGDLINQQLMINFFREGFSANGFAKARAHQQQRSTYQTLGALASSSIVSMRAVLEAIVYSAFIFVLPMSVLPMGFRFLSTWIWLVVWLQMWPPFFAIINYIMQIASQTQADAIIQGSKGLSFFTSSGLFELNQDIAALSGYLAASIPFITYAILQGGVSSFIHLAGAMMTPAHNAATTAAAEQTTGNYSFANASFGQQSHHNRTALQNNLAPSLTSGFTRVSDGASTTTYAGQETLLTQHDSQFRTNLFDDASSSNILNKSQQKAESFVQNSQLALNESVSNHSRNYADLTKFLSQSENVAANSTGREGISVQDSANYMKNVVDSFAKQHGISERDSMNMLLRSPSNNNIPIGAGFDDSNTTEETWNHAKNISTSESFQKHFQTINDWATSTSHGSMNDEGRRVVEGYTTSLDQVDSAQEQYQHSLSNMQQISENQSYVENMTLSERTSLNQPLLNWASEKFQQEGGIAKAKQIILGGTDAEKSNLVQEFLSQKRSGWTTDINPSQSYQEAHDSFSQTKDRLSHANIMDDTLRQQKDILSHRFINARNSHGWAGQDVTKEIQAARSRIDNVQQNVRNDYNDKIKDYEFYYDVKKTRNFVGNIPVKLAQTAMDWVGEWTGTNPQARHSEKFAQEKPFWYSEGSD